MPYKTLDVLPDRVKDNLPKHAQDIYQKAFNSAFDEYKTPNSRKGNATREETSHKVTWSAVKKEYRKVDGQWKRDSD